MDYMKGITVLESFLFGFWLIWSSDREVFPLSESLWFTIICIFLRSLTSFQLPIIDPYWGWFNGILWLLAMAVFFIINRSNSFATSLLIAAAGDIGYFQLSEHLPQLILDHLL